MGTVVAVTTGPTPALAPAVTAPGLEEKDDTLPLLGIPADTACYGGRGKESMPVAAGDGGGV